MTIINRPYSNLLLFPSPFSFPLCPSCSPSNYLPPLNVYDDILACIALAEEHERQSRNQRRQRRQRRSVLNPSFMSTDEQVLPMSLSTSAASIASSATLITAILRSPSSMPTSFVDHHHHPNQSMQNHQQLQQQQQQQLDMVSPPSPFSIVLENPRSLNAWNEFISLPEEGQDAYLSRLDRRGRRRSDPALAQPQQQPLDASTEDQVRRRLFMPAQSIQIRTSSSSSSSTVPRQRPPVHRNSSQISPLLSPTDLDEGETTRRRRRSGRRQNEPEELMFELELTPAMTTDMQHLALTQTEQGNYTATPFAGAPFSPATVPGALRMTNTSSTRTATPLRRMPSVSSNAATPRSSRHISIPSGATAPGPSPASLTTLPAIPVAEAKNRIHRGLRHKIRKIKKSIPLDLARRLESSLIRHVRSVLRGNVPDATTLAATTTTGITGTITTTATPANAASTNMGRSLQADIFVSPCLKLVPQGEKLLCEVTDKTMKSTLHALCQYYDLVCSSAASDRPHALLIRLPDAYQTAGQRRWQPGQMPYRFPELDFMNFLKHHM